MVVLGNSLDGRVAVTCVVTCHQPYVQYLDKCLRSIDRQTIRFQRKIVVLDSVTDKVIIPPGWERIDSLAANPNISRDLALKEVKSEYVVYWDADNEMPIDFLEKHCESVVREKDKGVAFFYPAINFVFDDATPNKLVEPPPFNYGNIRERTYIDTSSIWKTSALRAVGGWGTLNVGMDDWGLALRLTRIGYRGRRSEAITKLSRHSDNRSKAKPVSEAVWNHKTLGVVTLWSGHSLGDFQLLKWYQTQDFPSDTHLYWMINTGGQGYDEMLESVATALLAAKKISGFTLLRGDKSPTWSDYYMDFDRHTFVANCYNKVIRRIAEDFVLIVEDDNVPTAGDLQKLYKDFVPYSLIGAMGAAYRSRTNPAYCCAAQSKLEWRDVPLFDNLDDKLIEVGMIGGGFTLYENSALQKCLPLYCAFHSTNNSLMGWDGNLGLKLTELGYKIYLNGGVKVKHMCKSVIDYEQHRQEKP